MRAFYFALVLVLLPAMASAERISGRVVDEAGRPVAGAEVHVQAFGSESGEPVTRELRTDAAGAFSWDEEEPPVTLVVAAYRPGLSPAQCVRTLGGGPLLLRLCAPRAVTGRLFTPEGTPAPGVAVSFHGLPYQNAGVAAAYPIPLPVALQERFRTQTDAAGSFRLEGLPPGRLFLIPRDPRFASVMAWFEAGDRPVEVRLQAGCRVRGRVIAGEEGLPGWSITPQVPMAGEPVVVTGADGSFLFYGQPARPFRLHARPPAGVELVAALQSVRFEEGKAEAEVLFRAGPGGLLRARAVDADTKAPLAGVTVVLQTSDGGAEGIRTGPDGTAARRLPAGTVRLSISSGSQGERAAEAAATLADGRETVVELPVRGWKTLPGKVLSARGEPEGGVFLLAAPAGRRGGGPAATAVSMPDGSFVLRGFLSGSLEVSTLFHGEGLGAPLRVDPPYPQALEVRLGPLPQVTIVGRVVDERGRPAARLRVWLQSKHPDRDLTGLVEPPATETDAEGRYRIVLRALTGEYSLLTDLRYRTLRPGESLGDQGAERRFSDVVVLSSGASVSGRVLDGKGQPVEGATLFWPAGTGRHLTATGADGRFRLEGLPDRPVALAVEKKGIGTAVVPAAPGREVVVTLPD